MQNTFSQSGNDSKWFLKKSFFKIGMWHLRPPRDPPPPFMANAILNFHFDFLTPSLRFFNQPAPNLETSSILHKTCSSINYMSLFLGQAKLAKSRLFAVVVYLGLKIAIPFRLLENLTSCAINSRVSTRRNTFAIWGNAQVILCS